MRGLILGVSISVAILALTGAPAARADESEAPLMKVIKVRGNQATVVFSKKRRPLKVGESGILAPKSAEMDMLDAPSRDHFVGLETGFSMLETKVDGGGSTKTDQFNLSIGYGWNKLSYEYGPLLQYSFEKQTSYDTKTLEVGGLFDYNFKRNVIDEDMIFGFRFILALGQQDNSAQSAAARTVRLEPGFFVKWFGLGTNLAAIGYLGYRSMNISADSGKSTVSGIVGRIGIQTYF